MFVDLALRDGYNKYMYQVYKISNFSSMEIILPVAGANGQPEEE